MTATTTKAGLDAATYFLERADQALNGSAKRALQSLAAVARQFAQKSDAAWAAEVVAARESSPPTTQGAP
ncbi:MAG: hypothetical protein WC876_01715 [Candidatus Thermoplasmatota archaeon]|jgi:hypothetical protein